jgi:hypothetical protein
MPAVSLVVCVHRQRDLLERLLQQSAGCYDDLVVVHDGLDMDGVRSLVEQYGGRFFEAQREYQQEPHWSFAWAQAGHDWILRLDADEFPSPEMKSWLKNFRESAEPPKNISGFTCTWPLWNGRKTVSQKWPAGRIFLFHRQCVRFFGMVENVPAPDGQYVRQDLVLEHQPKRGSAGLRNVLLRKQAYQWRAVIAQSLLGKPTDLQCWRWQDEQWPVEWEQIRQRPLWTALKRLIMGTFRALRDQWKCEGRFFPAAAINGPVHHFLICLKFWKLRCKTPSQND